MGAIGFDRDAGEQVAGRGRRWPRKKAAKNNKRQQY